jgi:hypothetical protein
MLEKAEVVEESKKEKERKSGQHYTFLLQRLNNLVIMVFRRQHAFESIIRSKAEKAHILQLLNNHNT